MSSVGEVGWVRAAVLNYQALNRPPIFLLISVLERLSGYDVSVVCGVAHRLRKCQRQNTEIIR